MGKFRKVKALSLLIVFTSYLALSCVHERNSGRSSIDQAALNIATRLQKKDYQVDKQVENPMVDLKKSMREALEFSYKLESRGSHRAGLSQGNKLKRMLVSSRVIALDENATFGVDDPSNVAQILDAANSYFSGSYSVEQINTTFHELNNVLLGYPISQAGVTDFFSDQVALGNLTETQREIMLSELQAIANAQSIGEIQNIVNLVNQELINTAGPETTELFSINAGIEGAIDSGAIAALDSNKKFTGAGVIIGAAILCVGIAVMISGGLNQNETTVGLGLIVALTGMMVMGIAQE